MGKLNYIDQQIEIGKLLNKEKEAKEWADDFQERAATIGDEIRKKIGDDATVSVIETGQRNSMSSGTIMPVVLRSCTRP